MSWIGYFKYLLAFGLLVGFYFLLSESFDPSEFGIAAGSSVLALLAVHAIQVRSPVHFSTPRDWSMMRAASPIRVLKDCLIVLGSIRRAAAKPKGIGALRELRLAPGDDGPHSTTRRALTIEAVSLAPNTYGIRFNRESLLIHQLRTSEQLPPIGDSNA